MIWLTSDHHFGHKMIIAYEDRPFKTVEEMDEMMISKWNEMVRPEDYVVHLGDFALCNKAHIAELVSQLNGYKVIVLGNHDRSAGVMAECGFDEVHKSLVLYRDDPWSYGFNSSYLLCTHRPLAKFMNQLNVAVECWDYYPVPAPTPRGWLNVHGHIHRSRIAKGV
jgi:calcineurin-like phosphoesterase family protein